MAPLELDVEEKKPKRQMDQLKPQRNEAAQTQKPLNTVKPVKTHQKTAKKRAGEQTMGGGSEKRKVGDQLLALAQSAQYEGTGEVRELLGPVFGPDHNPQYSVSRIDTSSSQSDPVIEMKSRGPKYDTNISYRPYGMVEQLTELAITLQFRNEVDHPGNPDIAMRDLKAGHNYHAGAWVVTRADIDEGAGTALVKIAKEKGYRTMSIGDQMDGGDFKVRLVDISSATGGPDTHPASLDVLDANDQVVGQIQVAPGETYTFTQPSTGNTIKVHVWHTEGGSTADKLAEVSILTEEHTLKHGGRFDNVASDDPQRNWFVWAGSGGLKKDQETRSSNSIDFSSNALSIYCDDIQTMYEIQTGNEKDRFRKGDAIQMPLGYRLRCDGMVNDWKSDISIRSEGKAISLGTETSPGQWDGNTRGGEVTGNLIRLSSAKGFFYNPSSQNYVGELYLDPINDKIYGKPSGCSYFIRLDGDIRLGDNQNSADPMNKLVYTSNSIGFQEVARHAGTPNVDDGAVYSSLSFELVDGEYRFKASDSSTPYVYYRGLNLANSLQYELPLTTERGSRWSDIGTTNATFRFNVGGNEPGMDNDGMARFKWSVLDTDNLPQFENPWETTPGLTKNGIDGRWRYPERYVIPSPNNDKYQDGVGEYWALSQEGTEFNFTEQDFKNRLDYFAYKIKPKDQWVVNESVVPIMGEEFLLTAKDDVNKIWELARMNGTVYRLYGQSGQIYANGNPLSVSDPFYGFKAYIGDCTEVEKLANPESRTGNDVLWLKKDLDTFVADAGARAINATARMKLDQQPRTRTIGFEIVKNKDFGDLGQMDAIQVNLQGWDGSGSKLVICSPTALGSSPETRNLGDCSEIYYVPTDASYPSAPNTANVIVRYKSSGQYEALEVSDRQTLRIYKDDKDNLAEATNQIRISHQLDRNGPQTTLRVRLAEPLGKLNEEMVTNGYPMVAETEISIPNIDWKNGQFINMYGLTDQATFMLTNYHVLQTDANLIERTVLETHTSDLSATRYNTKGTEIEPNGLTFKLFDNDTYPTRFVVQEDLVPFEKLVPVPVSAPMEYTDGKTKIGYLNYLNLPWLTYPNYSILPSTHSDQFQDNVEKAEFHIFSPLGTMFDPNTTALTNTPQEVAYHLGLKSEPKGQNLAFLFNPDMDLLQKPAAITDFLPLPSNNMGEPGTKIYGVLGTSEQMTMDDLRQCMDAEVWDKYKEHATGQTVRVWAIQDSKSVYLLADGFPVIKMEDWAAVDPDVARQTDPLCQYVAMFGEGQDVRDAVNNSMDKSRSGLWLLPRDLFGSTYMPEGKMEFPGGPTFTLNEKARDEMNVEIVERQFEGMDKSAKMYHVTSGNQAGEKRTMNVAIPFRILSLEEMYLLPKASDSQGKLSAGTLFDSDGGTLVEYNGSSLNNFLNASMGSLALNILGKQNDIMTIENTEGDFSVGSDSVRLLNDARLTFNTPKTTNSDNTATYNDLLGLDNSTTHNGLEMKGGESAVFDKLISTLDNAFYMENGIRIEPLGAVGNRQGVSIQYHSNLDYPVFWSMEEKFVPYQEGDPMAKWKPHSTVTSYLNTYPNPVRKNGELTIELQNGIPGLIPGGPGLVDIDIVDLLGRPVGHLRTESLFASEKQSVTIDLQKLNLMPGSYYFLLNAANNPMSESRMAKVIVTE